MGQEKMQALRNRSLQKVSLGPCFGFSALYGLILLSIRLPSPCSRSELSTSACSGQRPGLDSSRGGNWVNVQHPHTWPIWFHPLPRPVALGHSFLYLQIQCLEQQYRALMGGDTSVSHFRICQLGDLALEGSFLKGDGILGDPKSPNLEGQLCPPFSPWCSLD